MFSKAGSDKCRRLEGGGDWKKETTEGTRCIWEDNKMRDGKGREGEWCEIDSADS